MSQCLVKLWPGVKCSPQLLQKHYLLINSMAVDQPSSIAVPHGPATLQLKRLPLATVPEHCKLQSCMGCIHRLLWTNAACTWVHAHLLAHTLALSVSTDPDCCLLPVVVSASLEALPRPEVEDATGLPAGSALKPCASHCHCSACQLWPA